MTRDTEKLMNTELRRKILTELEIDPAVDAGKIGVAAENGIVTMTGTVPAFNEKWAAEEAVKRIGGVRGLASELRVELTGMHRINDSDIAATAASAPAFRRVKRSLESATVRMP
jgi:hypothetical protein